MVFILLGQHIRYIYYSYKHLHPTKLEAVGIGLVMGGQVVIIENSNSKHSGVNADAKEKDCEKTCHLVERKQRQKIILLVYRNNIPVSKFKKESHSYKVVVICILYVKSVTLLYENVYPVQCSP